jgi:diguanylate cyclase (GGDEF)-like protein/putative nucleotidyltransferase with HDIG domain
MAWRELPIKLKAYIVLLTSSAIPILWFSVWDLIYRAHPTDNGWIVLIVLTVLTVPFYLLLPSVSTIVGIGDAYVMAIAMIYGTSPCIIATLCHTFAGSLFVPNRPKIYTYRVIFNIASTVCCAWIYSNIYQFLNPTLGREGTEILLPIVALTTSFFILNSLSTATAISLASGQGIFHFWSRNYLSLGVEFSVSAVSAAFIVKMYSGNSPWVPLAVAPLIGVVWGWNKLNKAKAMEAEAHLKEQEQLYLRTVESLALAVDAKDQTTYGHIRRVRAYALGLAKLAGITEPNDLMAIETGSLLHDIGKLAIDDYILNKPGRLSKQEFDKMKMHATAGDEILRQIRFPFPVARYVRCHHERWDGQGYPDRLRGDQIPLGARILAISDAFDAIRSSRPYKLPFSIQDSIELLKSQAGTAYDPSLVAIFVEHISELESSAEEAARNMPELSFRKYFESIDRELSSAPALTSDLIPGIPSSSELIHIFEFCHTHANHLETSDILDIVARRLQRLIPHATSAVFTDSGDNSVAAIHYAGRQCADLANSRMELGKGISGWVTAYKRPIHNTSPALEFHEIKKNLPFLLDVLSVPLIHEGTCFGAITLYADTKAVFTNNHLAQLQAISEQLSPVLSESLKKPLRSETSYRDPVTETPGVPYLFAAAAQLISVASKSNSPLSLLCFEIRNYRALLNLHGLETANSVARNIAQLFRAEIRQTDILVRYGAESFVALLPGVRPEQAIRFAQRLQAQVRNSPLSNLIGHHIYANSNFAVASFPADADHLVGLLRCAHQQLAEDAKLGNPIEDDTSKHIIEFLPRAKDQI